MIGDIPMRRFESRIYDHEIIREILEQIKVVTVAMNDGDYPYVVPLNFGFSMTEEKLTVYLHSAKEGHKIDLWNKNPNVTLSFNMFTNHPNNKYRGQMHDYRSVMANGTIRQIVRGADSREHGIAVQEILRHNGRRPNQFSVPHYMFMNVYAVECFWKNVSAKSETPIDRIEDVRFPTLEEIQNNREAPYDYQFYNSYFCRKNYPQSFSLSKRADCIPEAKPLSENPLIISGKELGQFRFHWTTDCSDLPADCDMIGLLLTEEGRVLRRYDLAFYNQKQSRGNSVWHDGDDIQNDFCQESIFVDFQKIPEYCHKIQFVLSVYDAAERHQHLGLCHHVQVQVSGITTEDLAYSLGPISAVRQSQVVASLVKLPDGTWQFENADNTALDDWRATAWLAHYGLKHWKE